jgi:HEAT repeat protein
VVPLLGDDRVAKQARDFLRPIAPRAVGQLVDALLVADNPTLVRARVAWILGGIDDARSVDGLWRATSDAPFPMRVACTRAIARIVARAPQLRPSPEQVHAAIERELDLDESTWTSQRGRRGDSLGERSVLLSRQALRSVHESLEHVFTLLAISHERELIASALAGLASDDEAMRGTALELLESVLPAPLRRKLWPRLHAAPPARERSRSQQQIADELLKTTSGLVIDRESLSQND